MFVFTYTDSCFIIIDVNRLYHGRSYMDFGFSILSIQAPNVYSADKMTKYYRTY